MARNGSATKSNGNGHGPAKGRSRSGPVPPPVVDAAVAAAKGANGYAGHDLEVLLDALQAVRGGDFSVRLPRNQALLGGKIADAFNEIVAANERMAHQLEEVG